MIKFAIVIAILWCASHWWLPIVISAAKKEAENRSLKREIARMERKYLD